MSAQAHDLLDVVRQLRVAIARHARGGAWAASAAATTRGIGDAARSSAAEHDRAALRAATGSLGALATVRAELGDCQRCGLCTTRHNIVFGSGAAAAPLVFVGGAPDYEDDQQGEPFVGSAGALLDKMIVAMGWHRHQVYVANVVACRPPEDRLPLPAEISTCQPFMVAQLGVVAPKIIVALGQVATTALLDDATPITALRGRFFDRNVAGHAVRIMPTFHPRELLQTPEHKRQAWADLQLVIAELAVLGVAPGGP